MKRLIHVVAFALIAQAASANTFTVWPVRVELQKRAAYVYVSNDGAEPVRFSIEKDGGDWLVAGPLTITVDPGKTGRFKVGRTIEPEEAERKATLIVKSASGNAVRIPIYVPAVAR
jgi:P pilus assembly chaperone PapD